MEATVRNIVGANASIAKLLQPAAFAITSSIDAAVASMCLENGGVDT